ncbi:hypothetical protein IW140_001529 [Coemansia sp. RSA 1813]|nr:hypothetical protein EV178_002953 [Coemansia sp. RSA 1646]KAJ1768759.1 hypothetical protein LPJ74_004615 [Coemansia sp. RSA 1843]KAJ2086707.1 hypothetical protein IW138_005480 [Coemansia sp. RSA 986]KAJ2211542.1 hypothetical protein EV179_005397 [Coemansia sp. RSA 487]KAJ2571611.1 hypothetical protein IW140_001529 [Coemansia sp. RSA 1813]
MNTTTTPKRIESRDFYRRPGQLNTSSEKAKRNLDFSNPSALPFFTNTTSVNIATAFAHARITSDTINKRPAHLKGTPMSPSQISKMNLQAIHPDDNPRAHFESSVAPRPHGTRPIRDITAKTAAMTRPSLYEYQDMDLDTPVYRGHQTQNASALTNGFLRQRDWTQAQTKVPVWFKKQQEQRSQNQNQNQSQNQNLLDVSPPKGVIETPSLIPERSGIGAQPSDLYTVDLMDFNSPGPSRPLPSRNVNGARSKFGEPIADLSRATAASSSLQRNASDGGWQYTSNNRVSELERHSNAGDGNPGITGVSYLDNRGVQNGIGSTQAASRLNNGRTLAYGSHRDYGVAGSLYGQTKGLSSRLGAGKENLEDEDIELVNTHRNSYTQQRPISRYSTRSHATTPGRLSYDLDFNLRDDVHNELLHDDHVETASRKTAPAPTPYTARIKGPGAFPATAQRFSQRKNSAQEVEDDDIITPTVARKAATRTASGHAAMTSGDLLSNHQYLRHGSASHRGWGEYAPRQVDDERASMHSFSDSFISNSTAGAGDSGDGASLERDNPTLLKRLLRNIAAGWTGSAGSFAERVSFIFFMIYFLLKETAAVVGAFVYRLLYSIILGPVYSGIRETILLPASLWRVLTPGGSHDTAQSMSGILIGLTVVALSIVVSQYSQSFFGGLSIMPRSLFGVGWLFSSSHKKPPLTSLKPLTDEEIERFGGHGSAVVDRLIGVEQTLRHLYGLLDTLKSQNEEDSTEVRDTLARLQQERQSLVESNRGDQQRIDNLEREYVNVKRDLKANQAKSTEFIKNSKEVDRLKKYVEKLAKNSGGSRWGRSGPSLDDVRRMIKDAIKAQEKDIKDMLKPEWLTSDGDAAYTHVARMIEDALNRYANDRLGKADFALFSAGARIIPGLTSPTFEPPVRGISQKLWRKMGMVSSQPPTAVLDPNTHVGECWPMQGNSGQVAIHLSQPIDVTDFAIEHVAKNVAIDWRSAPRQIEVWGYVIGNADGSSPSPGAHIPVNSGDDAIAESDQAVNEKDASAPKLDNSADAAIWPASSEVPIAENAASGHQDTKQQGIVNPQFADSKTKHGIGKLAKLASYEYEPSDTSALQIIRPEIGNESSVRVRTIILKVNSNWGHPEHTCIYRFRAHGHPPAL